MLAINCWQLALNRSWSATGNRQQNGSLRTALVLARQSYGDGVPSLFPVSTAGVQWGVQRGVTWVCTISCVSRAPFNKSAPPGGMGSWGLTPPTHPPRPPPPDPPPSLLKTLGQNFASAPLGVVDPCSRHTCTLYSLLALFVCCILGPCTTCLTLPFHGSQKLDTTR